MKILATLAVLLLVLLALGIYMARLCFNEFLYTKRGSLAYWICLSPTIRGVPEVGNATDVVFHSSPGDGTKPSRNRMTYKTDATRDEVVRELSSYFQSINKRGSFSLAEGPQERQGDPPSIYVSVEPASSEGIEVTVTEVF